MDTYVQGVYAQRSFPVGGTDGYTYFAAVDCLSLYPELPPSIAETLQGYKCPNTESYLLQGNLGQAGLVDVEQFMFIVNSCEAMIPIREQLGLEPITCTTYTETVAALDRITVDV